MAPGIDEVNIWPRPEGAWHRWQVMLSLYRTGHPSHDLEETFHVCKNHHKKRIQSLLKKEPSDKACSA